MTTPPHILLIDDDPIMRTVVVEALPQTWQIDSVTDTAMVFTAIAQRRATLDCVIVDYHMPGLDGVAVGTLIRTRWPHLRIVAISGDPVALHDFGVLGAIPTWSKHEDPARLHAVVTATLHCRPSPPSHDPGLAYALRRATADAERSGVVIPPHPPAVVILSNRLDLAAYTAMWERIMPHIVVLGHASPTAPDLALVQRAMGATRVQAVMADGLYAAEAAHLQATCSPPPPVLLVSTDLPTVLACRDAQTPALLTPTSTDHCIEVINAVLLGLPPPDPRLDAPLALFDAHIRPMIPLLLQGYTTRQIGERVGLAETTIKRQQQRVYARLGALEPALLKQYPAGIDGVRAVYLKYVLAASSTP